MLNFQNLGIPTSNYSSASFAVSFTFHEPIQSFVAFRHFPKPRPSIVKINRPTTIGGWIPSESVRFLSKFLLCDLCLQSDSPFLIYSRVKKLPSSNSVPWQHPLFWQNWLLRKVINILRSVIPVRVLQLRSNERENFLSLELSNAKSSGKFPPPVTIWRKLK